MLGFLRFSVIYNNSYLYLQYNIKNEKIYKILYKKSFLNNSPLQVLVNIKFQIHFFLNTDYIDLIFAKTVFKDKFYFLIKRRTNLHKSIIF